MVCLLAYGVISSWPNDNVLRAAANDVDFTKHRVHQFYSPCSIANRLHELVCRLEFFNGEGTAGGLGGILLDLGGGLGRPHSCLNRNVPGSSVADPVKSERLESAVFAVFGQKHLALKPIHNQDPILRPSFWASVGDCDCLACFSSAAKLPNSLHRVLVVDRLAKGFSGIGRMSSPPFGKHDTPESAVVILYDPTHVLDQCRGRRKR